VLGVKIEARVISRILPHCWSADLVRRSTVHVLPVALVPDHSLYANPNPTYRTTTTAGS